jgi:hypothetical protein
MPRLTGVEVRELGERELNEDARRDAEPPQENVPPPTGTAFVLSLYFLLLIVMWVLMFFGLLGRG